MGKLLLLFHLFLKYDTTRICIGYVVPIAIQNQKNVWQLRYIRR